jgi:rubrerythrin
LAQACRLDKNWVVHDLPGQHQTIPGVLSATPGFPDVPDVPGYRIAGPGFATIITTTVYWRDVMGLKGSKTEDNLKAAFAGESQANRRYLYFANKADIEGQNDLAALFRSTAEGETGHAHGHLEYLEAVGDPATGLPIGASRDNLKSAVAGETHEYTDMYPGMAKSARDEGFSEIADWFETLAKAERSHANRFQKALDGLVD